MKATSIAAALALACGCAAAQSPNPYDGTWKATWEGRVRPQEAKLVVSGTGGTWKTFARSREDPCVGLEVPITVTEATAERLTFTTDFAKVVPGCAGYTVSVTPNGSELEGKRGTFPVKLKRD